MIRILAAVLLCAASSVGCSGLNGMNSRGPIASQQAMNRNAPRPLIQRAAFDTPGVGVTDMECPYGNGCQGCGMCGDCSGAVDRAVSCAIDCPGCGCGDACGNGGCYGGQGCGPGGCQGGCQGGCGQMGACTCGGQGRCACCMKIRSIMANCVCGGQGQCPCCQHVKTMIGGPYAGRTDAIYNFNPGPPAAQTAYPYYTTRGPRDFLNCNPTPIGPY